MGGSRPTYLPLDKRFHQIQPAVSRYHNQPEGIQHLITLFLFFIQTKPLFFQHMQFYSNSILTTPATSVTFCDKRFNRLLVTMVCLQLHHKHPTFRCVHALLHGASRLKHWCFEVSHSREHLLKTTTPWYNATLWVGILRNLRKHC